MTKEQLKTYRDIKKEHDHLAQKIIQLKLEMYGPRSQRMDGMPRSGPGENYVLEERMDQKTELLQLLKEKAQELVEAMEVIEHAIEKLEPRERHLVRLHYIDGLTWEQVAVEMGYSWRQVHRIHGDALAKLKEEEENAPC